MVDWKPPKFGCPVWMSISATDVARAHKFYSTVFNWYFKPQTEDAPESKLRRFDFSPDVSLSGGIVLVPDEAGVLKTGHGGTTMFWLVEDLERVSEVIVGAGGKMLSGPEPESNFGVYRYFEDTEGNMGSVYEIVQGDGK